MNLYRLLPVCGVFWAIAAGSAATVPAYAADLPTAVEPETPAKLYKPVAKKLIGLSIDPPDTKTVRDNLAKIEAESPFNGIAVGVRGVDDAGKQVTLANVFAKRDWKRSWFQSSVDDLKAIRAQQRTLTNNFVLVRTNDGNVDWYDDAGWKQVVDHWRIAAWVAHEAGMKGLLFDPENYSHLPQFNIPDNYGHKDSKFPEDIREPLRLARAANPETAPTNEQFKAKVRQRGREVMKAVAEIDPNLTIYCLWMNSLNFMASEALDPEIALKAAPSGFYPAFIDGWLDVAPPTMTFVDGNEWAYGYDSPQDYLRGANDIRNTVLSVVSPENRAKYKAQVQASSGIYLDPYVTDPTSRHYLDPKGVTPTERIRLRTSWALDAADEYVWVYGEQYNWWPRSSYPGIKPDYWNDKLPGITPALASTTQPAKRLDYMLAQLKAEGKATNLIKNGEFLAIPVEPAAGGAADWATDNAIPGWTYWQTEESKGIFLLDPTVTHSGVTANGGPANGSAKVTNVGLGGSAIQVVTVEEGENYLLRAWTRNAKNNPSFIRVRWKTSDERQWTQEGKDVLMMAPTVAEGQWSLITGTLTVPPGAGKLILLMMVERQSPEDAVWFDDVELYKLPR
jgi:hypothetical protein